MLVVGLATNVSLWAYPFLYALQCGLVLWLLWRYRGLTSELNWRFHWLAVPTAVLIVVVWILLGWWITGELAVRWHALWQGQPLADFDSAAAAGVQPNYWSTTQPHDFAQMHEQSGLLFWSSALLRLFGMAVVVAMFEELFTRSLLLRAFHRCRPTMLGLVQVLEDLPLVGDWILSTRLSKRAAGRAFLWTVQFKATPLGRITVFSVVATTVVFTANHLSRDWLACIITGVVWCLLIWWTNREDRPDAKKLGLGPVIWSHGLTNAMLWAYCVGTGDWQFL